MTKIERLLRFVKRKKLVTREEVRERGFSDSFLQRLLKSGQVERVSHGVYAEADLIPSEYQSLLEISLRVPSGVICLVSALSFHRLTTQLPFEVWYAIESKMAIPRVRDLPVRFVRMSGRSFSFGIQEVRIEGRVLRMTTPAKTVADCFKYRRFLGLDVALEALKTYLKAQGDLESLCGAARVCSVESVLRPYIEAMLA